MRLFAAAAALAAGVAALPSTLTVTPWCDNAFRVQLAPSSTHVAPATAARQAHLRARLAAEGLNEVPAALIPDCGPGAPLVLTPGTSTTNGNAAVSLSADGAALLFSRVDTGALFSASLGLTPVLTYPLTCARGFPVYGKVTRAANLTLAAAQEACDADEGCVAFSARLGPIYGCSAAPLDGTAVVEVFFVSSSAFTNGDAAWRSWAKPTAVGAPGFLGGFLQTTPAPASADERFFGLGQGGWTLDGGCAVSGKNDSNPQVVVPLQRNGQTLNLHQRKFHVTVPYLFSTAGYGLLWNMPSSGAISLGPAGSGGMAWSSEATLGLDFWVAVPHAGDSSAAAPASVYRSYADATGHAPLLPPDAMLFWQSRNRYKSSAIAEAVAQGYTNRSLPVGVLVVDYRNQVVDGDFIPNPDCFPSVAQLAASVRGTLNATTVFSFWPEVRSESSNYDLFNTSGCLINSDLSGRALDTTIGACRDLIWTRFLKPNYFDAGVAAYWLDETDGEGSATGDGELGYETSYGPAVAYSNLWVGSWLSTFSAPVAATGTLPLVLARGVWAGAARLGVVLWSSDIASDFEELKAQVNLGVHSSLSGIPWWTSDVGGYGCGDTLPNNSTYMQELIVRWYQFGLFSPVFRTHGCRNGPSEPDVPPCTGVAGSCGPNEIWSYGPDVEAILETYVTFRAVVLAPYIADLARNVSATGVPTVRPLWWEFPDGAAGAPLYGVDDQFMLGPDYLVAPVTTQGATSRVVIFPGDSAVTWTSVWNASDVVQGGITMVVPAPLTIIPAYKRS